MKLKIEQPLDWDISTEDLCPELFIELQETSEKIEILNTVSMQVNSSDIDAKYVSRHTRFLSSCGIILHDEKEVVMEGLGDSLKAAGAKMKEIIQKILDFFENKLTILFDQGQVYRNRLEKLNKEGILKDPNGIETDGWDSELIAIVPRKDMKTVMKGFKTDIVVPIPSFSNGLDKDIIEAFRIMGFRLEDNKFVTDEDYELERLEAGKLGWMPKDLKETSLDLIDIFDKTKSRKGKLKSTGKKLLRLVDKGSGDAADLKRGLEQVLKLNVQIIKISTTIARQVIIISKKLTTK